MKSKHEIKACPRCGVRFECKLNNPVHCDCAELSLSKDLLEQIEGHYRDCLCIRCLSAIQADPGVL